MRKTIKQTKFNETNALRVDRNKTIERVDNENYCLSYPISTTLLSSCYTTPSSEREIIITITMVDILID